MIFKLLIRLANDLDQRGMIKEADLIDSIIKSAISNPADWLRKQYNRLNALYSKKHPAYEKEAAKTLDEMLKRKQSGPEDERIFIWFCQSFPNTCNNCKSRHGRMRTLKQWRAEGLPPSVCQNMDCQCRLIQLLSGGATDQMDDDADVAAGIIGLRQDTSGLSTSQGFILEPFFSDYGKLE